MLTNKAQRNPSRSNSRSRSRSRSRSPKSRDVRRNDDKSGEIEDKQRSNKTLAKNLNALANVPVANKFVWGKKLEEMQKKGINTNALEEEEREKQNKINDEIEKVRKRRLEREKEQKVYDRQRQSHQQEKEEDSYKRWLEKEEQFHTEQAKLRSEIRIMQGREKPVDNLVKILLIHRGKFDYDSSQEREIRKPYTLLARLTKEELLELYQDIKEQIRIEINDFYTRFWNEMLILIEDKLHLEERKGVNSRLRNSIIGEEFENEVNEMIGDKSYDELIELEKEINQTLDCPSDFKIDVEYWENVLKKLKARKAKAYVEEMGSKFLDNYKQVNSDNKKSLYSVNLNSGDLSPRLIDFDKRFEALIITQAEDIEALNEERGNILVNELQNLMNNQKVPEKGSKQSQKEGIQRDFDEEDSDGAGEKFDEGREEEEFNELVDTAEQHYDWTDKYNPRRPQYFNRVKIGYEWNKYNQTHYDQDNPPPKIVQGYKFNVFYQDLIDPTKAPEFHLEGTDNPDYCNIRFHAGPPYEDIAFKIWNREWDFSDKQGFKCIFEHNILHLYFNFRKARYRR